MTAIDLYSGIGGWDLGLRAAGIEVVQSFEWWDLANQTHGANGPSRPDNTDIRRLDFAVLPAPESIDFVVGSPPCTQFSFANRGGNGDLDDGMIDIIQFLEVVRYLKPKGWAMENVPRVAEILRTELESGCLADYRDLFTAIVVVDMSEFGLPQRRKRMIAGNFDSTILLSYADRCKPLTLGEALAGLSATPPTDSNWGFSVDDSEITDHVLEPNLSPEELRMNREAKAYHPIYNKMAFPDELNRPSRTITATCTRVSRESVVIPHEDGIRRLTIRERALLQGFPLSFQFPVGSHADRAKMIGNAVPPVLTYYIAQALMNNPLKSVVPLPQLGYEHRPNTLATSAVPDVKRKSFPLKRSFRSAIPGLRFNSGIRFELRNTHHGHRTHWSIDFYYGSSKSIIEANLDPGQVQRTFDLYDLGEVFDFAFQRIRDSLGEFLLLSGEDLQARWANRADGPGPFELNDLLGEVVASVSKQISTLDDSRCIGCLNYLFPNLNSSKVGSSWLPILSGAAVAATFISEARCSRGWQYRGDKAATKQPMLALDIAQAKGYLAESVTSGLTLPVGNCV